MIKRKRLGQHFLNSKEIARRIVSEANISKNDTVFEVGTGLGVLTPLLCEKAKSVISVEADRDLFEDAQTAFSDISNLRLIHGDGFKITENFSIFVSNLPYSESKNAIEWLAQLSFLHGVIMVQKEFAEKLFAEKKPRRAITIIANYAFDIEKISTVNAINFSPRPQIDSVILRITHKNTIPKQIIQTVNKIFSYRRKKMQNIFKQFGKDTTREERLDDLLGDEIIEIAKKLNQ